jgi:PAS domain S-box-containing protein
VDSELLARLVDELPDPVVAIDRSFVIRVWNRAAERLFGASAADVVGHSWLELGQPEQELARGLAESIFAGQPWQGLFPARTRSGRELLVRHRATPLRNPDGTVWGLVDVQQSALPPDSKDSVQTRMALVWRASALLGSSLDVDRTLAAVADLLVPALADHCVIDLFDPQGRLVRLAVAHGEGIKQPEGGVVAPGNVVPYPPTHPVSRALALGRAVVVKDFSAADVQAWAPNPTSAAFALRVGAHAVVAVPLRGPRGVRGALTVVASRSRIGYDADDVDLLEELAARAGLALDNAALYGEQRAVAGSLQESLLPREMPSVEGAELAFRYDPMSDADVGGDFFDAVPLSAGRVGLIVGDVQGRGAHAAAVMGQIRAAFRAYAVMDLEPGRVLEYLDAVVHGLDEALLVTCVHTVFDPFTREVVVASAGHPGPLLFGPQVVRPVTVEANLPLGAGGQPFRQPFSDQRWVLERGEGLLFYTDGVVEHRSLPLDDGLQQLCRQVPDGASPEEICAAAMTITEQDRDDDRAVLALRAGAADLPYSTITVSATAESVAPMRRHVACVLESWGLGHRIELAELLASEVVTNAVRHAVVPEEDDALPSTTVASPVRLVELTAPRITLSMRRGRQALWVEVADSDVRLPRLRLAGADDEGGRGLYLVDALADRWGTRPLDDGKVVWFELATDEA